MFLPFQRDHIVLGVFRRVWLRCVGVCHGIYGLYIIFFFQNLVIHHSVS